LLTFHLLPCLVSSTLLSSSPFFFQNKAYAFSGKFPDENYAREIMQLFTIGLWKLNNDGTRMTDPNDPTQYIPTYDIEDIVQFSRVWVRVFFCFSSLSLYY